jgi:CRISPR-associated protein Cas5h
LINTKGGYWIPVQRRGHEPRTQIKTEFLKDPCFRIYIRHLEESILTNLAGNIAEHKTFYTPCLGLSELLADFSYVGFFEIESKKSGFAEISTVIPISSIVEKSIEFEEGKKYFKEKIPIDMKPDRVVERYEDVLFEAEGKSIKLKLQRYWEIENGEKIIFL